MSNHLNYDNMRKEYDYTNGVNVYNTLSYLSDEQRAVAPETLNQRILINALKCLCLMEGRKIPKGKHDTKSGSTKYIFRLYDVLAGVEELKEKKNKLVHMVTAVYR